MPTNIVHDATLQFCQDGQDISGQMYAGQDADEIRAWTPDGTCLGAVSKSTDHPNAGEWEASASDSVDWVTAQAAGTYQNWEAALAALLALGSIFLPDRLYREGNTP